MVDVIVVVVIIVVVVGLNTIFQHTIGYTWQPVLMFEGKNPGNPQKEPLTHKKLLASFLTYPHWPNPRNSRGGLNVVVVVVGGFNTIFRHTIGYTWRPVLLVEKETGKSLERTTDP